MLYEINWEPQERQLVALKAAGLSQPFGENLDLRPTGSFGSPFRTAIADIIGYGGSAGGGKTDTLLAIGLVGALAYPGLNIAYFRREFPQLEGVGGAIQRSTQLLSGIAKYNEQKHRWHFPTKSVMQFCHCKDPRDMYNYQSWQIDILLIDESTQFTAEIIDYLITRNRATVNYPTFKPFTALATNPGNIGHAHFRDRFVNLGEREVVHDYKYETGQLRKHVFIPSKLNDNQILVKRDPDYSDRLSTSIKIKKTLLEGDWDTPDGQFFDKWRFIKHVINPFIPKKDDLIVGGMDWGSSKPFSFHLATVNKIFFRDIKNDVFPFYRVKFFYEAYGTKKSPEEWSKEIKLDLKRFDLTLADISWVHADPTIFNKGNDMVSVSIRDQFMSDDDKWRILQKANNDRIPGWVYMDRWMGDGPDGEPFCQWTSLCVNAIRTIPDLIHDETKPEDVNTEGEDHAGDGNRYCLKNIKLIDGFQGVHKRHDEVRGNAAKFFTPVQNMDHHLINLDKFIMKAK
jgi:Terminase large subunit, T4likevirus-type, N-terminal